MIIDHIGVNVQNAEESRSFYEKALAPLGIHQILEYGGWYGFGKDGKPEFWFGEGDKPHHRMHLAFLASNRQQVRDFYEAALAAGGKDNGKPGIREVYHPDYYGAFVIDPNGHNIEAVCHLAE